MSNPTTSVAPPDGPSPALEPGKYVNRIDRFLSILPTSNGSDLHLTVGSPPIMRIDGELERSRHRPLKDSDYFNLVRPITPPALWDKFLAAGDADFAYQMGKDARFRVNIFRQERGMAAVFRLIPWRIPTVEELGLPNAVSQLASAERGLVLVTGPTGSGKSTTLAAILDRVNKRFSHHVITIEDPIEFVHTNSAAKAVDRIIDAFPATEQDQIRTVLAEGLRAVVAQQLLKKKEKGRVAAYEILIGSTALSNAIREGKTNLINNQIQTGKSKGMISMDQSLGELVRTGIVEPNEALDRALDKETFKTMLAALPDGRQPSGATTSGSGSAPAVHPPAAAR